MADNIPHVGSEAVIAADLIGGVHYQRVKIILGAEGVNDGDLSSSFEAERIRHNMQTQLDAQRDAEIGMRMRNLLNRRNETALMMILAAA